MQDIGKSIIQFVVFGVLFSCRVAWSWWLKTNDRHTLYYIIHFGVVRSDEIDIIQIILWPFSIVLAWSAPKSTGQSA